MWHSLRYASWSVLVMAVGCADDVAQSVDTGTDSDSSSSGTPDPDSSSSGPPSVDDTSSSGGEESSSSDGSSSSDPSSSSSTGEPSVCGDATIQAGEDCDGEELGGQTCADVGFDGGRLACSDTCEFDTRACTSRTCGNDVIEGAEVCDGTDLAKEDCVSQGFSSGTLACARGCAAFDTTGCITAGCGNDLAEKDEACDGTDLAGTECPDLGFLPGTLACADDCSDFVTDDCGAFLPCCEPHADIGCADEDCQLAVCGVDSFCCDIQWDGICANEALQMCEVCGVGPGCGNGTIDGAEVCDQFDFGGEDCISQGFEGGQLFCSFDCMTLDTSNCFNFGGDCCAQHNGPGCDDQACMDQMCALDTFCCDVQWDFFCADQANDFCEVCGGQPGCGDNVIGPGEVCDNFNLDGETCQSQGFLFGSLACGPGCTTFDVSNCANEAGSCCIAHPLPDCDDPQCSAMVCAVDAFCCQVQWDGICASEAADMCPVCGADGCGNGIIEFGETCDGDDVGTATCATQGFDTGVLGCQAGCDDFDTTQCLDFSGDCCSADATPGCGNQACSDLVCSTDPSCCQGAWDQACADAAVAACAVCAAGTCGNNVIELGETCDGTDLDQQDCVTSGFDAGTLACAGDCTALDTSSCVTFEGDCCAADLTPGCDDSVCTQDVCEIDPTCCTGAWDDQCVTTAAQTCAVCGAFFDFSGVLTDLPVDDLIGWEQCYVDTYATGGTPIDTVLAQCDEENLLMACRQTGSNVLLVAANAPRDDVTFPTGVGNIPHDANGVGWYFDGSWSWGFAPEGADIFRDSCDIVGSTFMPGPFGDERLCFQTFQDALAIGWRCGTNQDLNFSAAFERVFYQRP